MLLTKERLQEIKDKRFDGSSPDFITDKDVTDLLGHIKALQSESIPKAKVIEILKTKREAAMAENKAGGSPHACHASLEILEQIRFEINNYKEGSEG